VAPAFLDERDEETAGLRMRELVGGVLEAADEYDELLRGIVGLGLGERHEVIEHALVGGGVALQKRAPQLVLGGGSGGRTRPLPSR
jgi:hypothetical protein